MADFLNDPRYILKYKYFDNIKKDHNTITEYFMKYEKMIAKLNKFFKDAEKHDYIIKKVIIKVDEH